jgi:hypothetical protein
MRSHSGHSGSPLKVKLYALPDSKRVFHNRGPHHRKINQKIRGLFLVSAFKRRRCCFDLSTPLDSADASRRIQDHCGNVGKGLDRKTTRRPHVLHIEPAGYSGEAAYAARTSRACLAVARAAAPLKGRYQALM